MKVKYARPTIPSFDSGIVKTKMKKRGSNQHRDKYKYPLGLKKDTFISVMWLFILLLMIGAFLWYYKRSQTLISPVPQSYLPTIVKTVEAKSWDTGDPIIDEISRVFKNEGTKTVAKAIICFYGESKLNTYAYNFNSNGTADVGIAQINDVHGMTVEERQDYKKNIKKAYELYKRSGWKPWYANGCK